MVVHPTDHGGHVSGTLVNALLGYFEKSPRSKIFEGTKKSGSIRAPLYERGAGGDFRWGLVHRLDRDTSGVMVVAKTEGAKKSLTKQFADREVEKTYLALVAGRLKDKQGRIEAPIGRDQRDRIKRKVSTAGDAREAITEFKVAEEFKEATLLEVKLLTGRTHQIRVHFLSIKHPVIGDPLYGSKKTNAKLDPPRLFLHAWKLAFIHPKTKERVEFESGLPPKLEEFLGKLQDQS